MSEVNEHSSLWDANADMSTLSKALVIHHGSEISFDIFQFGCSRKVCFCTLGTSAPLQTKNGRSAFLQNAKALQNLLSKPRLMLGGAEYVEVLVPHLQHHPKKTLDEQVGEFADDSGDDGVSRRAGSRRKATYSVMNDSRQVHTL